MVLATVIKYRVACGWGVALTPCFLLFGSTFPLPSSGLYGEEVVKALNAPQIPGIIPPGKVGPMLMGSACIRPSVRPSVTYRVEAHRRANAALGAQIHTYAHATIAREATIAQHPIIGRLE